MTSYLSVGMCQNSDLGSLSHSKYQECWLLAGTRIGKIALSGTKSRWAYIQHRHPLSSPAIEIPLATIQRPISSICFAPVHYVTHHAPHSGSPIRSPGGSDRISRNVLSAELNIKHGLERLTRLESARIDLSPRVFGLAPR